jgi:hypothetical protein
MRGSRLMAPIQQKPSGVASYTFVNERSTFSMKITNLD